MLRCTMPKSASRNNGNKSVKLRTEAHAFHVTTAIERKCPKMTVDWWKLPSPKAMSESQVPTPPKNQSLCRPGTLYSEVVFGAHSSSQTKAAVHDYKNSEMPEKSRNGPESKSKSSDEALVDEHQTINKSDTNIFPSLKARANKKKKFKLGAARIRGPVVCTSVSFNTSHPLAHHYSKQQAKNSSNKHGSKKCSEKGFSFLSCLVGTPLAPAPPPQAGKSQSKARRKQRKQKQQNPQQQQNQPKQQKQQKPQRQKRQQKKQKQQRDQRPRLKQAEICGLEKAEQSFSPALNATIDELPGCSHHVTPFDPYTSLLPQVVDNRLMPHESFNFSALEAEPKANNPLSLDIPSFNFVEIDTSPVGGFPSMMHMFKDERFLQLEERATIGLKLALGNSSKAATQPTRYPF